MEFNGINWSVLAVQNVAWHPGFFIFVEARLSRMIIVYTLVNYAQKTECHRMTINADVLSECLTKLPIAYLDSPYSFRCKHLVRHGLYW